MGNKDLYMLYFAMLIIEDILYGSVFLVGIALATLAGLESSQKKEV